MDESKQQLLATLRDSANVLVTVTVNPSVDQLAGAIGLTLLLNKLGKHATAIFSGHVPDVMEFLKPDATLEKNTDSLRDFIISLDKSKADKLRYKVEDTMVKIFITPYHTALTDKDLEFSQGDYNVDLVVAIGAHAQADLDKAITSHGQILHDAVISSINNQAAGNLGTINWVDAKASSLCEMIFDLCRELQPEGIDPQMATSLLTGIVSETHRFGNDKTTAKSLEASSLLVAAGANQQLVAAKLEEHPQPIPEKKTTPAKAAAETTATDTHKDPEAVPEADGTMTIEHEKDETTDEDTADIHIDEEGKLHGTDQEPAQPAEAPKPAAEAEAKPATGSAMEGGSKLLMDPPALNSEPSFLGGGGPNPTVDPLNNPVQTESNIPLLSHDSGPAKLPSAQPLSAASSHAGQTLAAIESSVHSPHVNAPDLAAARDAVDTAAAATPDLLPKPAAALNAQNLDLDTPSPDDALPTMSFANAPAEEAETPPPVPPPMMPSFATADTSGSSSDSSNATV